MIFDSPPSSRVPKTFRISVESLFYSRLATFLFNRSGQIGPDTFHNLLLRCCSGWTFLSLTFLVGVVGYRELLRHPGFWFILDFDPHRSLRLLRNSIVHITVECWRWIRRVSWWQLLRRLRSIIQALASFFVLRVQRYRGRNESLDNPGDLEMEPFLATQQVPRSFRMDRPMLGESDRLIRSSPDCNNKTE